MDMLPDAAHHRRRAVTKQMAAASCTGLQEGAGRAGAASQCDLCNLCDMAMGAPAGVPIGGPENIRGTQYSQPLVQSLGAYAYKNSTNARYGTRTCVPSRCCAYYDMTMSTGTSSRTREALAAAHRGDPGEGEGGATHGGGAESPAGGV